MNLENARRLLTRIPQDAKVVDVGGGASPFPRADYVIDALAFDDLGSGSDGNIHTHFNLAPRYTKNTWIQVDLCDRRPWPVEDKFFDYAICSHLLEDIRDPIWVCSELCRIARAGYLECPSRYVEQSKGVENPRHAGYYHHRWLVSVVGKRLEFRHKPHVLHSINDAIVAQLGPGRAINPIHSIVTLEWESDFESVEILEFDESRVIEELCCFAQAARELSDLVVHRPLALMQRVKREFYFWRLSRGKR